MQQTNLLYGGHYRRELMKVRDGFAHRWRDRKRAADRKLAPLREEEGLTVRLWRKVARKPWPANPDAEELRSITAVWEDEELRRAAVDKTITALNA